MEGHKTTSAGRLFQYPDSCRQEAVVKCIDGPV